MTPSNRSVNGQSPNIRAAKDLQNKGGAHNEGRGSFLKLIN